jgi:hypothetical protein
VAQDTTNSKKTTVIMKNTHLSIHFMANIVILIIVLLLVSCFNNTVKTKELSFCSQSPSIEKLHISSKTDNKKNSFKYNNNRCLINSSVLRPNKQVKKS